jgi:hypothetical protein
MTDLNKVVPPGVIKNLDDVIACLESLSDIRVCLSLLVPIGFAFRGLCDLADDPKAKFLSYLIMDQLGNVQSAYDGKTEGWYKLNSANIVELRKALLEYCKVIRQSILSSDYQKFIDGTEVFFNSFHPLARSTTMDVRERE